MRCVRASNCGYNTSANNTQMHGNPDNSLCQICPSNYPFVDLLGQCTDAQPPEIQILQLIASATKTGQMLIYLMNTQDPVKIKLMVSQDVSQAILNNIDFYLTLDISDKKLYYSYSISPDVNHNFSFIISMNYMQSVYGKPILTAILNPIPYDVNSLSVNASVALKDFYLVLFISNYKLFINDSIN